MNVYRLNREQGEHEVLSLLLRPEHTTYSFDSLNYISKCRTKHFDTN